MNENFCLALITVASIFAGFLVAFLGSYLTNRNKQYDEYRLKFDALGRKLTLFRQLCGFLWMSNCLKEQRRKLMVSDATFDEDGNIKSFMHALKDLYKDLGINLYIQNPYIDYRAVDLDRVKVFVNSIWYDLIHKNYNNIHFNQPLCCPSNISSGYFKMLRKELSFGYYFSNAGMNDREFGTIAGNVECEIIDKMLILQLLMHKAIDCDIIAIIQYTILVFVLGVVIPLFLLWGKNILVSWGDWDKCINICIQLLVLLLFLYCIIMVMIHTFKYFEKS